MTTSGTAIYDFTHSCGRIDKGIDTLSSRAFGNANLHIPNITDVPGTDSIVGLKHYKSRIIGLLARKDYICLPEQQTADARMLADYFRFNRVSDFQNDHILEIEDSSVSVEHLTSNILKSPTVLRELTRLHGNSIEPFIVSPRLEAISNQIGKGIPMPALTAERFNDKWRLRRLLEHMGISTPGGILIDSRTGMLLDQGVSAVEELRRVGHIEFCITRPHSCSGQGMFRFRHVEAMAEILQTDLCNDSRLLIEPWIQDVVGSPSFQVRIGDTNADDYLIGITDQILCSGDNTRGPAHLGNSSPSEYCINAGFMSLVGRIIDVLRNNGARGLLGVDLIVTRSSANSTEILVSEVNARMTGSMFGALLATKVRGHNAQRYLCHNNISVSPGTTLDSYICHLESLRIHYHRGSSDGVIVVSNGNLRNGKIMIVAMADGKERLDELVDGASMVSDLRG